MIVSVQPKLTGVAAERYLAMARTLARAPLTTEQDREALLSAELRWAASHPTVGEDRYAFMAAVHVLLDLERLGWKIREDGYGIELYSIPSRRHGLNPEEILEEKKKTKEVFRPAVEAQLRDPAVRAFIQRMEAPTPKTGKKSITGLIAEGAELHARLLGAQARQGEDRDSSLSTVIRPYLQLVTSEGVDEHTGHFLREIWRYFRHTWAIPQFSTPGRQLLYLVRDAAHPNHAVMGIIGLTNTALQMGVEREKDLCWNLEALSERFGKSAREGRLAAEYEWMETQLAAAIEDVHAEGLASPEEITHPKPALISLLRRKAKEFDLLRDETLKELARLRSGNDGPLLLVEDGEALELGSDHPPVDDEVLNLEAKPFKSPTMQKARRHLVARKRAALLADLLHARLTLRTHRDNLQNPERFLAVLAREEVRLALQTVLDAIKSRYAGVNMLEISTCGAIPPYNHILGGKLAALLLYSPQIGDDYRRQYSGASIISSQIKNAEVYRDNPLVYLGTTSLYAQGSSQYERVRLPAGTISEQQPELRFRRLGLTAGFGTLQFLSETRNAVEEFLRHQKKFKDVNSIFGEGPSPKLRLLVAGLRELGFPPDALMRHNRQRLIYVTALAPQAVDFLNNRPVELPDYLARPQDFRRAGERVVNYWVTRWLAPRLRHVPSMTALMTSGSWKLSDRLPTLEEQENTAAMPPSLPSPDSTAHSRTSGMSVFFWRQLAEAGPKITSDSLSESEFDRLHVHLAVEDFIAEQVRQGVSLFLTGNAGDGKTHVLRKLASELRQQGAVVIEDATATMRKGSIAPVLDRWREAVSAKKPFCIAINEYPLHLLRSAARKDLPSLAEELDRQCRNRLVYGESSDAEKARNGLLVIDLSLRNPLSQGISGQMLNRILSDPALEQIPAESVPLLKRHLTKLRDERVRKRVLNVFDRLVEVGVRTTMRELWIILARMVLGYDGMLPTLWARG